MIAASEARADALRRKIRGLDALSSNAGAYPAESRAARHRAEALRAELRRLGLALPETPEQAAPMPSVCATACGGLAGPAARDDLATMRQAALLMAMGICFLLASMLLHALHR